MTDEHRNPGTAPRLHLRPDTQSRITVLVTACGDSPDLRDCLRAIRRQADDADAAVLLIINAKRADVSAESVSALRDLAGGVLFVETPGKSNALNRAIESVESEVVAFTDDDAMPQPGWLHALTAPLLEPKRPWNLVGTGGRLRPRYPEQGIPKWYSNMIEGRPASVLGPRHDLGDARISYAIEDGAAKVPIGANCAFRREVFHKFQYAPDLGPNHATGLKGGEDTELALRLLLGGFALEYVPDAIVDHPLREERLGVDYCKPRFFSHGVELSRLRKRLGIPMKSRRRLRFEHRFSPVLHLLRPLGLGWSRQRIALEREKLRGMLWEVERESREADARS